MLEYEKERKKRNRRKTPSNYMAEYLTLVYRPLGSWQTAILSPSTSNTLSNYTHYDCLGTHTLRPRHTNSQQTSSYSPPASHHFSKSQSCLINPLEVSSAGSKILHIFARPSIRKSTKLVFRADSYHGRLFSAEKCLPRHRLLTKASEGMCSL